MHIHARLFVVGIITLVLTGCAGSKIRSDYDPTADFSQYNTYNFFEDAGPDATEYQSFFSRYMVAAVSREMEACGYTRSDSPDLLVNFNAILRDKTDVRSVPATPTFGAYYGYRGGFYDPWMGYPFATETYVSQYTEGTLNIDLVDAGRKTLVWEAVATGRVTQSDREQMKERVDSAVAQFFETFPFTAGSGTPVR